MHFLSVTCFNPQPPKDAYMRFSGLFLAIFLPLFVSFRNKTNTLHAVRVSKTKLTLENALIGDLFVSRGKRESKYDERALFWSSLWSLDLSRPSNSLRKTHICVLPDCFSFSYFLASSCNFQILRVSSLNSALNLG